MKVVILAAGFGTRLYPLTENKPKALLDIKGKLLIEHILDRTPKEAEKIYIITNNKFYSQFLSWKNNYKNKDKVELMNDDADVNEERLGGLGDLQYVINKANVQDDLLIILSDNYFNFYLGDFLRQASKHNEIMVGVYAIPIEQACKFGVVNVKNNEVEKFEEKPKNPRTNLISTGIYFFPKNKLHHVNEYLEQGGNKEGVAYLLIHLLGKEKILYYKFCGDWHDVGSIEEYNKLK